MADFHSCSALMKSNPSYLEHLGPPPLVEKPSAERSISSLSSKLVGGLEGDPFQLESGGGRSHGGGLSPSRHNGCFKRGRWEDINLDAAAKSFSGQSSIVGGGIGYSVSISNNAYSNRNGNALQCSSQLPHLPIVTPARSSTSAAPFNFCVESGPHPVMPPENQGGSGITFSNLNYPNIQEPSPENPNGNNGVTERGVNVTDLLAELQRERQKNTELLGKISSLEEQLGERVNRFPKSSVQDDFHRMMQNSIKKLKKTRKAEKNGELEDVEVQKVPNLVSQVKRENLRTGLEVSIQQDPIVNWMSREEVQISDLDKSKDGDSAIDEYGDSDESDDDEDNDDEDDENDEEDEDTQIKNSGKKLVLRHEEGESEETGFQRLEQVPTVLDDGNDLDVKAKVKEEQTEKPLAHKENVNGDDKGVKKKNKKRKGGKKNKKYKELYAKKLSGYEIGPVKSAGNALSYKKVPKMAFCPKEVKRIMESGVLALKNAQSHTIRKIIVFSSLGIRHGCEDMYELDFNCFSILRRGEPYVSPQDPGEHVLYEQPGVRRKIFYPNRQNPILCPVRILEEEKTMRPSDPSCPSCLFLCIKYGGRTRNLPQNEYVRQRMGRNKLKSFGPLICQMSLLVHIRTGSFFFKALGITLLFMAGFPDDLVQKETKYRNLDLLQKYYRSDEDAEGEELFHPYPMFYATQAMTNASSLPEKGGAAAGKVSGKKQPPLLLSKPRMSQKAGFLPPISARSMSPAQFGPITFLPVPVPSRAAFPPLPRPGFSSTSLSTCASANSSIATTSSILSHNSQFPPLPSYAIFAPYGVQRPNNGFLPMPMWPNVHSYPHRMYPSSSYGCQSFPPSSKYGPHPSQPYYNQPFFSSFTSNVEGNDKKDDELDESNSDSDSSSSEADEKCNKSNVSDGMIL